MNRLISGTRGFTLIEVIMAIVVLAIVGTVASMLLYQGAKSFERMDVRQDLALQARLSLERMTKELRLARCTSGGSSCRPSTADIVYPAEPLPASSTEIRFVNTDTSGLGFRLSGGTLLLRQGSGGADPEDILSDNATGLTFTFLKQDGTAAATVADVWMINVTLTLELKGDSVALKANIHPRAFY